MQSHRYYSSEEWCRHHQAYNLHSTEKQYVFIGKCLHCHLTMNCPSLKSPRLFNDPAGGRELRERGISQSKLSQGRYINFYKEIMVLNSEGFVKNKNKTKTLGSEFPLLTSCAILEKHCQFCKVPAIPPISRGEGLLRALY